MKKTIKKSISLIIAMLMIFGVFFNTVNVFANSNDDSLSKEGTIYYSGLDNSDIEPNISESNNARLDWESTSPQGLGFDPVEDRFTIGIIDYDNTYATSTSQHSTYKEQTGKDYYITISVDSIHNKDRSENVYLTVFDKSDKSIVGSTVTSVGDIDKPIQGTKHFVKTRAKDIELSVTYITTSSGSLVNIKYPKEFNNGKAHPYITLAFHAVNSATVGNYSDQIQCNIPDISSINTYYAIKGENGQSDIILAGYKNTGLNGSKYTMSGRREIAGFDLSEEPENKTRVLFERYVDGKTYLDYEPKGSALDVYKKSGKGIVTVRAITAVGNCGYGVVKILKADINNYDVNDLDNAEMWETMYASEVLAPGEWGTTGNSNFHAGHPGGGFNDGFNVHYKIVNNFVDLDKEPVYYYTPQGVVRVHYIDKSGNVIKDLVSAKTVGTTKTASAINVADVNDPTKVLDIVDYHYNKVNTSYDVSATEYKLSKIKAYDGSIYYYTETKPNTGKESTETVMVNNPDGTSNSFVYKVVDDSTVGMVKSSTFHDITYVYEKGGNVIVKYFTLDDNGNVGKPLSGTVTDLPNHSQVSETEIDTDWGKAGTEYSTIDLKPSIIIDNEGNKWELVAARTDGDPETGDVESDMTKVVKYYYSLVKTDDKPTKKVFKGSDTTDIDGKEVKVGETLTYKVSYHNTTGKSQKVVIEDKIPEFTSYVEGSADNNGVYKDGKITWTKENVAVGETFEVTFKVKVEKSASGKTLINEALVRAGQNESKTNKTTNPVSEIPPTPVVPNNPDKKDDSLPKTGNGTSLSLYAWLMSASGALLLLLDYRRRKYVK